MSAIRRTLAEEEPVPSTLGRAREVAARRLGHVPRLALRIAGR